MKKKIDPQLLIAIGVLIASFSALFVYMKQAVIMTEQTNILLQQTKANSWPHLSIKLQLSNNNGVIETCKLRVDNKGTGPAIINGIKVSYAGKAIKNWDDLFQTAQLPDSILTARSSTGINDMVISANEKIELFSPSQPALAHWIFSKMSQLKIEICYQSVFDEIWVTTLDGLDSNLKNYRVQKCPFRAEDLFF